MNPTAVSSRSSLDASPDGQWLAVRRGDAITLLADGHRPVGTLAAGSDDIDVAFLGAGMLVVVVRNVAPRAMLYRVPSLEVVGRHDLPAPMRIVAVTQARLALSDGKQLVFVRIEDGSLAAHAATLDGPLDVAAALAQDQLLVGVARKLEIWDALTGRAVQRVQLPLPAGPRTVGAARGHVWVTRPGVDELVVHRLSDGRTSRHALGALQVSSHHASPVLAVGTAAGLVRVHCGARAVTALDTPWAPGAPITQLVLGDDISVLGLAEGALTPWRAPIAGAGAPPIPAPAEEPDEPRVVSPRASTPPPVARPLWRETLAAIGAQLVDGGTPELVAALDDSELADLADRLLLSQRSIRALIALYGLYLVGEPQLSIADLAHVLGDWSEPLGSGELGALAMLDRERGRVSLRSAVTDLLDGARPRAIRIASGAATSKPASRPILKPHLSGAWRYPREGKSDVELEALLAAAFGKIAIVEGDPDRAILEARLRGATAVAFHPPPHRPAPWPRDANLVLVLYGSPSSWIADLPNLEV